MPAGSFSSRFLLALSFAAVAAPAFAVDTGIGRAAAAVANIDPTSAVAGSTEIRSFPGQEADAGVVQLFRFANSAQPTGGSQVNSIDGRYTLSVGSPLTVGDNVYVKHLASGAVSTTAVVQAHAPPYLLGPLASGATLVNGYAAPDTDITIEDAISGAALGNATSAPGTGAFSVAVPALRLFQAVRAVDGENEASAVVTVLGFAAATSAGLPPPTCNATVLQASSPSVTRFECGLLNPRGLAVLPSQSLAILAGLPPTGLINIPPPATVRFDPSNQQAELFAPVTGVATVYDPGSNSMYIARPHLFRLQSERMLERQDGEILKMDMASAETTVATRLLDIAPTGLAIDSTVSSDFGGGLVISSLFYGGPTAAPAGTVAAESSPLWMATLTAVEPLNVSGSQSLVRLQGLAIGQDWDSTPTLFAAQPGSGTIFRIHGSSGNYSAATLLTGLGTPVEVAFPPSGSPFGAQLYATDAEGGRILKITLAAGGGSTAQTYVSGLDRPYGLAFGATGLFVTEYGGNIVAIYP